jgi:hypothetical protein
MRHCLVHEDTQNEKRGKKTVHKGERTGGIKGTRHSHDGEDKTNRREGEKQKEEARGSAEIRESSRGNVIDPERGKKGHKSL